MPSGRATFPPSGTVGTEDATELLARVEKLEREVRDLRHRLRSAPRLPGDRWAAAR